MANTVDNVVSQFKGFSNLSLLKQLGLLVGLAASVAIGVSMAYWVKDPNYRVLYSNLSASDGPEMASVMDQAGVQYKLSDDGSAMYVKDSDVHNARLLLASKGMPKATDSGYEILDKKMGFGVSSFMENARYQQALEGELAKTISSINGVKSARVHLAIPKKSVFVRDKKIATASVAINLYSGKSIGDNEVSAITHLIAASVTDVDPENVTVIDQKGRLLTSENNDPSIRLTGNQFEYRKKLEDYYSKRIESLIEPMSGAGTVRAQVSAEIDFSIVEQTQETFNPDLPAIRSEQTIEEESKGASASGGVAGSLSNQVPSEVMSQEGGQGEAVPQNSTKKAVRNYELDKTISHTRFGSGNIRRVSAAVVVDYASKKGKNGDVIKEPLSEDKINRIKSIVMDAVGYDPSRGDSVNVVNVEFSGIEKIEDDEKISILDRPEFWMAGKIILTALVVLLLIFGVLRPVLKELAKSKPVVVQSNGEHMADMGVSDNSVAARQASTVRYDDHLTAAMTLAKDDPKRVAQVIQSWVGEDGR